jgi:hypothetical protein
LRICCGGRTKPQPYNKKLKDRLLEILNSDYFGFLVGVPRVFGRKEDYPAKGHWERFFKNEKYLKLLDPKKHFYSSFISRMESAPDLLNANYWELVKMIWFGRNIVLVEGNDCQFSDACLLTNEFDKCASLANVEAPSKNAFGHYGIILREICQYPKDFLIVISLGATATVLSYDLYKRGYQALDVGRLVLHHYRVMEQWGKS